MTSEFPSTKCKTVSPRAPFSEGEAAEVPLTSSPPGCFGHFQLGKSPAAEPGECLTVQKSWRRLVGMVGVGVLRISVQTAAPRLV